MNSGSYEGDVAPIRGDVFLDKLFGWLVFTLALVVLGAAVARLVQPGAVVWLESARIFLIVLSLVGFVAATRSTASAYRLVFILFLIRVVGVLALYPWAGGPRYFGNELLFDLVVLWYARLRIKKLTSA